MNGDLVVNLTDVVLFAEIFFGQYVYAAEVREDLLGYRRRGDEGDDCHRLAAATAQKLQTLIDDGFLPAVLVPAKQERKIKREGGAAIVFATADRLGEIGHPVKADEHTQEESLSQQDVDPRSGKTADRLFVM